ncbi:MAG: hypothetical protein AAFN77_20135 [Planctomycetota bacterium]
MVPNQEIKADGNKNLEVVIGVFSTPEDASRVSASLRGPEMRIQRVSRRDPVANNEMPQIVYDDIESIDSNNVANGAMLGGAIGVGSGLLLFAIPGLNVAAPIVAGLAGAWIGGVAAVDEANRGVELPNQAGYQKMLAAGKSFVVIAGDEVQRSEFAIRMSELGAEEIFQHPPVNQVVRDPE